jgi:hypothetical protein
MLLMRGELSMPLLYGRLGVRASLFYGAIPSHLVGARQGGVVETFCS